MRSMGAAKACVLPLLVRSGASGSIATYLTIDEVGHEVNCSGLKNPRSEPDAWTNRHAADVSFGMPPVRRL